jgi:hypothetical protein
MIASPLSWDGSVTADAEVAQFAGSATPASPRFGGSKNLKPDERLAAVELKLQGLDAKLTAQVGPRSCMPHSALHFGRRIVAAEPAPSQNERMEMKLDALLAAMKK